jgi:hypothetical protein
LPCLLRVADAIHNSIVGAPRAFNRHDHQSTGSLPPVTLAFQERMHGQSRLDAVRFHRSKRGSIWSREDADGLVAGITIRSMQSIANSRGRPAAAARVGKERPGRTPPREGCGSPTMTGANARYQRLAPWDCATAKSRTCQRIVEKPRRVPSSMVTTRRIAARTNSECSGAVSGSLSDGTRSRLPDIRLITVGA